MAEKIKLGSNGNFGVKEGGTLAYNDENGVFKAIELASSRSSAATYVAESGLIADAESGVPRIDWTNGVGELLLEPQSTNLVTQSEDNLVALNLGVVTNNAGTSPSGIGNAQEVTFGSTQNDGAKILSSNISATGNTQYTISFYAKNISGSGAFNLRVDTDTAFILFNEDFTASNDWVRYSHTFTTDASASVINTNTRLRSLLNGNTIQFWGFQIEQLSYPTSYIRTSGSAVTRIADAVTGNESLGQVINSSEGVLYAEMSALADDSTTRLLGLNGGSVADSVLIGFNNSNGVRAYASENGGSNADINSAQTITDNLKVALKWSLNDVELFINGSSVGSDVSFNLSSNLDELEFNNGNSSSPFYGRLRELKVYDTALTDAELTTLTTL